MSDFDKEAERERLREKYGDDEAERESTQRMSELLLKGATMTNKHCGRCGDPIFRHDGQEFCPSCQADGQQAAADASPADADGDESAANAQGTPQGTNAEAQATADSGTGDPSRQQADATSQSQPGKGQSQSQGAPTHQPQNVPPQTPQRATDTTATASHASAEPVPVDADAVAQVEATIERFAAAAANTDDPERARECLSVVREAAETLRVLRAN